MEVKLTSQSVALLQILLVRPGKLMPDHPPSCVTPYPVPDPASAMEIAAILNWLETKLFKKDAATGKSFATAYSGPMNDALVKRIKHVTEHYKTWGLLTHNCIPYLELVYGLSGKDLYQDLPSVDGR